MREIKFRAWNTDSKELESFRHLCETIEFTDVFFGHYINLELMQYTGLKDSHGNEIYEGDILEAVFEMIDGELKNVMDVGVVVFKDYAFQVQTFEDHHEPLHEWVQLSEELKVIGNIYENPELLPEVPQ